MTTEPNEAEHTYWLTLKTDPAVTYLARGRAGLPNTYWVGYADVAEEFDYGGAAPHGYAYTHDPEAPPEGSVVLFRRRLTLATWLERRRYPGAFGSASLLNAAFARLLEGENGEVRIVALTDTLDRWCRAQGFDERPTRLSVRLDRDLKTVWEVDGD